MMRAVFTAACLILLFVTGTAAAQSTVFLVRHAERADGGGAAGGMSTNDPDLSAAGRTRAESLANLLKDAKITAVFTSEFKRTQQTAAPLAKALGIQAVQVPSKDSPSLVKRIKSATGNILVVGHSNTVPEVIKALGVKEAVTIGDQDFDNLFVLIRSASPKLVRLHYH
jgi:phosphohistidine phosphatase SixA